MHELLNQAIQILELGHLGYAIVFAVAFLESLAFVGWFFPGTILVIIAGSLAAHGYYHFWTLVGFATAGAILGDGLSFELGKRGKEYFHRHDWFMRHMKRGETFFAAHGRTSVLAGRFIGPLRPVIPVIAGMADMERWRFYAANVVSGILWSVANLGLGFVFGAAWRAALLWSSRFGLILIVAAVTIFLLGLLWRWALSAGKNVFLDAQKTMHSLGMSARAILFAAILVALMMLLGVMGAVLAGGPLVTLDRHLENLFAAFRFPTLLSVFYAITLFGESPLALAAALVTSGGLWLRKRSVHACTIWIALLGSGAFTLTIKEAIARPRPSVAALAETSAAFPSAHAAIAVGLYGFLCYLILQSHRPVQLKIGAFMSTCIAVFLIDLSRLYLGVHYLSDVLAGNCVGLIGLLAAIGITGWCEKRLIPPRVHTPQSLVRPVMASILTMLMLVLGSFVITHPAWRQPVTTARTRVVAGREIAALFSKGLLPPYTESIGGSRRQPINVLILATDPCLVQSLAQAGWRPTDPVTFISVLRLLKRDLLREPYDAAPAKPAFWNTMPNDSAFERSTGSDAGRRHHLRLWMTSFVVNGMKLFVASARLDSVTRWIITHQMGPFVDAERDLLAGDLRKADVAGHITMIPLSPRVKKLLKTLPAVITDGRAVLVTMKECQTGVH